MVYCFKTVKANIGLLKSLWCYNKPGIFLFSRFSCVKLSMKKFANSCKLKLFPFEITAALKELWFRIICHTGKGVMVTTDLKPAQGLILQLKLSVSVYQRPNCFSCDFWWNTNVTPLDQAPFNIMSSSPFLSAQWFHCDRFALQSVPSGGGWTWMLFTHRRHLNLCRKGKRHCYIHVGLKTW